MVWKSEGIPVSGVECSAVSKRQPAARSRAKVAGDPLDTDDGLQAAIERSSVGHGVISALVIFTLVAVLISNLPQRSEARTTLLPRFDPYLVGTGLKQGWGVFAPDPTRRTSQLSAEIRFADGSITMWHLPRGGNGLSEYRWFRWRQFGQDVMNPGSRHLRPAFARWIAAEHATEGRKPVIVTLIRRTARTAAPGTDDALEWKREAFYRLFLRRTTSGATP